MLQLMEALQRVELAPCSLLLESLVLEDTRSKAEPTSLITGFKWPLEQALNSFLPVIHVSQQPQSQCSLHIQDRSHPPPFFYKIIKYIYIYLYIYYENCTILYAKKKKHQRPSSNATQTKGYSLLSWYQMPAAKDRHK